MQQTYLLAAALAVQLATPLQAVQGGGAPPRTPDAPQAPEAPDPWPAPPLGASTLSVLSAPLYLGEHPPEVRSMRHVYVPFEGVPGAMRDAPTREEAEARCRQALEDLAAGVAFPEVARRYSRAADAGRGAVLGSFPPGVLATPFDDFLRHAELGDVSEWIEDEFGFHLLQRVETYAAARHILVRGDDAEAQRRIRELRARLNQGEDFGALAEAASEDVLTNNRGGVIAIFERGPRDVLLKGAAFDSPVGEVVGPIATPQGLHLFERLPLEEVDPSLVERTWVRANGIVLAYDGARGLAEAAPRTQDEARELALDLAQQLREGADFGALASQINDDVGGRLRRGDLGWLHRRSPKMSPILDRVFTAAPSEVFDPVVTEAGWMLIQVAAEPWPHAPAETPASAAADGRDVTPGTPAEDSGER